MRNALLCIVLGAMSWQAFCQDEKTTEINIITSDIDLFWECFDRAAPAFKADHFERYIEEGSPGVQDFLRYRIVSAKKLARKVRARRKRYEAVRDRSLTIKEVHGSAIKKIYRNLKSWYPDAVFPNAYFVIGRFNSGGTSSANGIIMGVETFNEEAFRYIPATVAHELIHFQQQLPTVRTLLGQSILEGSADFLGILIRDEPMEHHRDGWALPREKKLWQQFQKDMNGEKFGGWLYGGRAIPGSPPDIGYWMGYRITKAYYDRQKDKKQAIYDILHINDFRQFLEVSGYGKQFE